METLCGMVLEPDIRHREDQLLATLELEQEDMDLNFGAGAVVCGGCQDRAVPEDPGDNIICIVRGCLCEAYHGA